MNVKCPSCQVTMVIAPKRASGPVYTYQGIRLKGEVDTDTGIVRPSNLGRTFEAFYDLLSSPYAIVECVSCHKNFIYSFEFRKPVWPLPDMVVAEEIPGQIGGALMDAKKAHAVGAETAALLAARTALIRCQREQSVSKIKDLADQGKITSLLYQQADEIRLWANMTGHDDIPADTPESEDVEQLLEYLDLLFDALYVQPARLENLRNKRGSVN